MKKNEAEQIGKRKTVYCLNCGQRWIISDKVLRWVREHALGRIRVKEDIILPIVEHKFDCCDHPTIIFDRRQFKHKKGRPKEFTLRRLVKKEL